MPDLPDISSTPQEVAQPQELGVRVGKQTETEMNLTHNKLRRLYYDHIRAGKPLNERAQKTYDHEVPHLLPGRRIQIHHPRGYTDASGVEYPDGLIETAKVFADHREYLQHKTGGNMTIEEYMAIPKEERGLDKPRSHHDWLIFLEVDKKADDESPIPVIEQRSLATMGILDASWLSPEERAEQAFTYTVILPEETPTS